MMIRHENNEQQNSFPTSIGMESLSALYAEAIEADARVTQEAPSNADASPHYMIEKGWFDSFLSFKDAADGDTAAAAAAGHATNHPGTIKNAKLLTGESTTTKNDGVLPMNEDGSAQYEESKRQLRRQKWQTKERDHETSSFNSEHPHELLGGNANATIKSSSAQPSLLPNLRYQSDYVLVGEKTWNLISSNFLYDVEIPRRSYYAKSEETESGDGVNGDVENNNPVEKNSLVVEIYPCQHNYSTAGHDMDIESSKNNDERRVVVPPSGRWNNMNNVNSESGETSDSGDDLFPTLENEEQTTSPVFVTPQSNDESSDQPMHIVPFDQAKANISGLYNIRPNSKENKSDIDTSDEDVVSSPPPLGDDNEEVRITTSKRKRATGLGNLGNTCFMNSTLQCLAHTAPLREYFMSGHFKRDLNMDNPLGTGGELATEFASLLRQMWGMRKEDSQSLPNSSNGGIYSSSRVYSPGNYDCGLSSVTYPRTFKHTLGKHAEQFMGYDQHDSQELAIYLLDALHEDTNRVTKKPYVEKPEQGEEESDQVTAKKSWNVHLQREDSRILENFMGQIKSKLKCPKEECGRVSTTFDPCMYLSVPIPGAMDKVIKVTFFPLEPGLTPAVLTLKLNKMSTIAVLRNKVAALAREAYEFEEDNLREEDIQFSDVFAEEIYAFYGEDHEIDRIRDSDITYAYQLRPKSTIKEEVAAYQAAQEKSAQANKDSENEATDSSLLDPEEKVKLDANDEWQNTLEIFLMQPMQFYKFTNVKRSSHEERLDFYRKLLRFIQSCRKCSDCIAKSDDVDMKENTEDEPAEIIAKRVLKSPQKAEVEDSNLSLEELSHTSTSFKNVLSPNDLAVLEYCTFKFMSFIKHMKSPQIDLNNDGIVAQIVFKKNLSSAKSRNAWKTVGVPLVLRIPPTLTVFGLRKELGYRISNALNLVTSGPNTSTATLIMKQVAFSHDTSSHRNYCTSDVFGSVTDEHLAEGTPAFAKQSDDEEKQFVTNIVSNEGKIYLGWPARLNDVFDADQLELREEFLSEQQKMENAQSGGNKISVMECISKYCQIEQLEESDMWYCSRCKEHVQAWKQFHLYRTPPILIIHLKRFHFSAAAHRRDKIDTLIDFPLTDLDLRELVMHWEVGEEPIYDCYAVSNHFGGLGGGHYTAYAKGDDGSWSNFDDSRVTSGVDESDVVSSSAYCLYYKRKDVVFDNDKAIDELTQGMGSDKALVGNSDDGTSHEDMDIENHSDATTSPPAVVFVEDPSDSMDGDITAPIAEDNKEDEIFALQ